MEVVEPVVLTQRERDVVGPLARGCTYSQIADRLGVWALILPDIVAAIALLIALLLATPRAVAEERMEGTVRHTVVTHCDAHGCAGALALEGRIKTLTITVPLGTPISYGCGKVPFHRLVGKTVIVTEVAERSGYVARAIEVVEETAGDC